jgi:serine/threonine-protein kinase
MPLTPGETFSTFRIVEELGRGGMAMVYKALDPQLNRYVAIKVVLPFFADEPGFAERFKREAMAVAQLRHPHIVAIFTTGEEQGSAYIVTEFVDGGDLSARTGTPQPLEEVVRILGPIARALDYAHAQGVVHRDVKPSNILLYRDGTPVLSDFGIAKLVGASAQLTRTGFSVGTPPYQSPEHARGEPATPATDQYALAVVAYELLTGRVPFSAETPQAVLLAHLVHPLPSPRLLNPRLSAAVEEVLQKGLAKQPRDRYPNVAAFTDALAQAGGMATVAPMPMPQPAAPPPAAIPRPRDTLVEPVATAPVTPETVVVPTAQTETPPPPSPPPVPATFAEPMPVNAAAEPPTTFVEPAPELPTSAPPTVATSAVASAPPEPPKPRSGVFNALRVLLPWGGGAAIVIFGFWLLAGVVTRSRVTSAALTPTAPPATATQAPAVAVAVAPTIAPTSAPTAVPTGLPVVAPTATVAPTQPPPTPIPTATTAQLAPLSVIDTINAGQAMCNLVVTDDGTRVYATDDATEQVLVLDPAARKQIATYDLKESLCSLAFDQPNHTIYIPTWHRAADGKFDSSQVQVVDVSTGARKRYTAGHFPSGPFFDPRSKTLYIGNTDEPTLVAIDTNTGTTIDSIPVFAKINRIAVAPATGRLFLASPQDDQLLVYDVPSRNIAIRLAAGERPWDVVADPQLPRVMVSTELSGGVMVINTQTYQVGWTVKTGSHPRNLAVDGVHHRLYVLNTGDRTVSTMTTDGQDVRTSSPLPGNADLTGLAVAAQAGRVFVVTKQQLFVLAGATGAAPAAAVAAPAPTAVPTTIPTVAPTLAPTATLPPVQQPTATPSPAEQAASVGFKADILPIFNNNCTGCHGGSGGLTLDSYAAVMKGGKDGAVVKPGDPNGSLIVQKVKGTQTIGARMPFGGPPLSNNDVQKIVDWISQGAKDN